ncbi:type II toxin-antitoxin system HicB family antitoxin [Candidatus Peregrinibacteria bacterium]|jgi:predicted HicB family RNase H-like nuclease|nr:type II toxin-antitoxin system HicB family antitoxin [Candidatus Peregrinibacteria bacterium]
MKNLFKYKGYLGTIEYSLEDKIFHGQLAFIDDLITYEAKSVKGLEKEFQHDVDDYLRFCKEVNKEPQKPFRGVFNVRIKPALHKLAAIKAKEENISLNKLVARSVEQYVESL